MIGVCQRNIHLRESQHFAVPVIVFGRMFKGFLSGPTFALVSWFGYGARQAFHLKRVFVKTNGDKVRATLMILCDLALEKLANPPRGGDVASHLSPELELAQAALSAPAYWAYLQSAQELATNETPSKFSPRCPSP